MSIEQQNGDYNLAAGATIYSKVASADGEYEFVIDAGDGVKILHTTASVLTVNIVVGNRDQGTETYNRLAAKPSIGMRTSRYRVANGETVTITLLSSNANDTDVDVTVIPCVNQANVVQLNGALTDGSPAVGARPVLFLDRLDCHNDDATNAAMQAVNDNGSGTGQSISGGSEGQYIYGGSAGQYIYGGTTDIRLSGSGTILDGSSNNVIAEGVDASTTASTVSTNLDAAISSIPEATEIAAAVDASQTGLDLADGGRLDTILDGIAAIFTGLTSLPQWLRGLYRKDTINATALSEINAIHDGGAAGTFSATTDSVEAIRDTAPMGSAMRGTDGANTVAPDNTSIGLILTATNTGKAPGTAGGGLAIVGADGKVAASGNWYSGTPPTADDIGTDAAGKILVTPANKLVTDENGKVTPTDASKTGYALSTAGIAALWNALTAGFTTAGSIGKWLLDTLGAVSLGAGARTVTITVTDSTDPIESATVRVTNGATSFTGSTNASGIITFSLDDATWTVAITRSDYSFTPTTLVVAGDTSHTYEMTATDVPSSDPGFVTGYIYCYDQAGVLEAGAYVQMKFSDLVGTGHSYDRAIRTVLSDANGLASFSNLIPGATYLARRGTETDWVDIEIAIDATSPVALTNFYGEDE